MSTQKSTGPRSPTAVQYVQLGLSSEVLRGNDALNANLSGPEMVSSRAGDESARRHGGEKVQ